MIEIIYAKLSGGYIETGEETQPWLCWLELTRESTSWMLPATAPHGLAEEQLQAYFDEREDDLWAIAETKQYPPKLCGNVGTTELVRPLMLALLDEINFLRGEQGHGPLTEVDIVASIKSHLKGGN